jgi:reverse transcriptase-like protein
MLLWKHPPLLRHYDPKHPCRIETDASKRALGAILSQKGEDGLWRPVAFFSKQFKGAELRYGTPDQEMMAIVEAFKHWRHYLEGSSHPIEVLTDHRNLQSFMTQTRLNGRHYLSTLSRYHNVHISCLRALR